MINFKEYLTEAEQLLEKLVVFNGGAKYGQIVFMSGGAGSGKGFASSTFLESEKFKIRDVDEWKKSFLAISELKDKYPEIQGLDLKKAKDVYKLHMFVKQLGIKDKSLNLLLSDVKQDRLPNIIFDITGKSISDFEESIPLLLEVGYDPTNIHLAWILTNYKVAYAANVTRERVVPADVFIDTHRGAGKTMQQLIDNKRMPYGANGRFVVIMNNRENTIFFKPGEQYKGKTVPTSAKGVKDFYYITVKEAGKPFKPEETWKEELHKQIVANVPGGESTIDDMRLDAIEMLKKDLVKKDKKLKAYTGIGIIKHDIRKEKS